MAFMIILSYLKVDIPDAYGWISLGKSVQVIMLIWAVVGDFLSGIKKIQSIDWKK